MKRSILLACLVVLATYSLFAQSETTVDTPLENSQEAFNQEDTNLVENTFESTRVINGHSTETLRKGVLEFRVEHRFGDLVGSEGGVQAMFGLDNSSDIRLALEYGVTDKFMVGLGRSKGTGNPYRSLLDGFAKYTILEQQKRGFPLTVTGIATTTYSYMKSSDDLSQVSSFPSWEHRLAYVAQLSIARKFGERCAASLTPSLVHRNYVAKNDANTLFSLGGALRFPATKKIAILLEYFHVFHSNALRNDFTNSLGVAVEWVTFGHNFTIYLTNAKGFVEPQFITNTYEKWSKGQFRLGFCIGRKFERE
jgi:hypothetical protein